MTTMMYTTGLGFTALWAVHIFSVIAFFTGVLFFIVLAIRTFTAAQLKNWAWGLVITGIVACLFTIGVRGAPWDFPSGRMRMMEKSMMMRVDHDADDRMAMSMDDMTEALEDKTGDKFDAAFIEGMIPHHQGAIDMAQMALKSARHDEIKRMAADIIAAQQKEIDMMFQWKKEWGYEAR